MKLVLGGYHIFMMFVEYGFHETIYKTVRFSTFSLKIYMPRKGIDIFI